jgi:hypothetical protein
LGAGHTYSNWHVENPSESVKDVKPVKITKV